MVIPTDEINSNSPDIGSGQNYVYYVFSDGDGKYDYYWGVSGSYGIKLKIISAPYKLVTWKRLHVTLYFIMRTLGGTIMSEMYMSREAYGKLGLSILNLVGFYSSKQDVVDTEYRHRYVRKQYLEDDPEKIDIAPLTSELEVKVFLAKENPASFEYLKDAKEFAHTFIDACDINDLVAYGISKAAATRLDQMINNKYAILTMYEKTRCATNAFKTAYRNIVEKSYKEKHAEPVEIRYGNMSGDNLAFMHLADYFNAIMENDFTSISDGYRALSTDELFKALDNHRGDKLNTMRDIVNWAFTEEVNRFNDDFNKIILRIIS